MSLLSKMLSLAAKWGWRTDNPVKGIERFHEERRERWLSDRELSLLFAALLAHPNQRAANAVRFQILTGARIGEVLKARWSDIDLNRGVWIKPSHHTKQKRTEHIPLSGPTLSLLSDMRKVADPTEENLFPGNASGRPLQGIKKFWKGVTAQAGIADYRLHDNRHTHASHLVSGGLSLEIVGRLLGHTNPTTTKRYSLIADSPLRAATERFGAKVIRSIRGWRPRLSRLSRNDSGQKPLRAVKRTQWHVKNVRCSASCDIAARGPEQANQPGKVPKVFGASFGVSDESAHPNGASDYESGGLEFESLRARPMKSTT